MNLTDYWWAAPLACLLFIVAMIGFFSWAAGHETDADRASRLCAAGCAARYKSGHVMNYTVCWCLTTPLAVDTSTTGTARN